MTAIVKRSSQDQKIFESFKRFAEEALTIAIEAGGLRKQTITNNKARIAALESYQDLLATLLADERACARVRSLVFREGGLNEDDLKRYFESDVLLRFLENYIAQPSGTKFDAKTFEEVFESVEAFLLQGCHLVRSLAPLCLFEGPDSPIYLDDESTIRLATADDLSEISSRTHLTRRGARSGT